MNQLQQVVQARRGTGRRGRPPLIQYPKNLDRSYQLLLANLIAGLKTDLAETVIKELPFLEDLFASDFGTRRKDSKVETVVRQDIGDAFDQLERVLSAVVIRFGKKVEQSRTEIQTIAMGVNKFSEQQLQASFKKSLGVDLFLADPVLERSVEIWVKDNVKKITALGEGQAREIERIVLDGYRQGIAPGELRSAILDTFRSSDERETTKVKGMSVEDRAKFIARDQISTLSGQVSQLRQTRLGLDKYIWQTSEDERVRPEHVDRNGQVFEWSSPPEDGHPGMPINCRCVALPFLDDLLSD